MVPRLAELERVGGRVSCPSAASQALARAGAVWRAACAEPICGTGGWQTTMAPPPMERVRPRTELHRRGTAAGRRGGGARIVPCPVAGTSDEVSHRAGPGGRLPSPVAAGAREVELAQLERGGLCHPPWPVDLEWVGGWVVVPRRPGAREGELASAIWGKGAAPHGRRSRAGGRKGSRPHEPCMHRNIAMRSLSSGLTESPRVRPDLRASLRRRAWTCVQACVRLSRATCGLACGSARAACGPASGFAWPGSCDPHPPPPPSDQLSRGW